MDFLLGCGCFQCPLSSGKGSYNTYDRERRQHEEQKSNMKATKARIYEQTQPDDNNNNNNNSLQNDQNIDRDSVEQKINNSSQKVSQVQTMESSNAISNSNKDNNDKQPVLSSFTLEGVAELIHENKIGKGSVIVLVGAGMSTAAGVPDFRSPDTGIYANLQKYNLPHPEDVFKIDYFKNNPAPFYEVSRNLLPSNIYPTLSHYFIRLLNDKGLLLRCFSQNVDCLESASGLPKDKLCLAHGSFETGHCLRCNAEYSLPWMRKVVDDGGIPHCTKTKDCKGLIKPDVKFFGERLDGRFFRLVKEDFPKCELLIIIGSSLSVMPFAQLIQKVPAKCPRLLINKTKSGHNIPAIFRIFRSSNGLMYDRKGNIRDVAYLGECDDGCLKLAALLGWNEELIELARTRQIELERLQAQPVVE